MATIELSSMVDVGRIFCTACYNSEGDSPLILTFYLILSKLEAVADGSGYDVTSLEGVVDECVGMFSDTLGYLSSRLDDLETEIMAVVDDVENAKNRITNLEEERMNITHNPGTGGRRRRRSNVMINEAALNEKNDEINTATARVGELEAELSLKRTKIDDAKSNLEKWKTKFPHRTRNDIIAYGKTISEPAFSYFKKHFRNEDGDLFLLKRRALVCK